MLLLMVLSMLTLFLMLGAAYLLTTSRAWEAAKAYSRLTLGTSENRIPHARLLDDVMLRVVRGGTAVPESILADKYGLQTLSGTMTSCAAVIVSGTPQPLMTGLLQTGSTVRPTDLAGRVLTFAAAGRAPTSHRIVKAAGNGSPDNSSATSFNVTLDASFQRQAFTFPPSSTSVAVIVNGREFSGDGSAAYPNESWDGFDIQNDFLARVRPVPGNPAASVADRGSCLQTNSGAANSSSKDTTLSMKTSSTFP